MKKLPATEKTISKAIGRKIKSPILASSLKELGLDAKAFIEHFSPIFAELNWDPYDARRLQGEFLMKAFPKDKALIEKRLPDYYIGKKDKRTYSKWIKKLPQKKLVQFNAIKPWRRRSVSKFVLTELKSGIRIKREKVPQFAQEVSGNDLRSLPRVFDESPASHVENEHFYGLMKRLFELVKGVRAKVGIEVKKVSFTAHFMSVQATSDKPGDNSPEGAHEDGVDYIISALVINRFNLKGGQTQIIELVPSNKKEIIFRHTLKPGEFVFQADSGDELVYGTDLWHHVTPFYLGDKRKGEGWRDIVGLDIMVEESKSIKSRSKSRSKSK